MSTNVKNRDCHTAVYFSEFPAQAHAQAKAELRGCPFVLIHAGESAQRQRVIGVSLTARRYRIFPGMLWERLKKRPGMHAVKAVDYDETTVRKAEDKLREICENYTPNYSLHQGVLHLDLSGTQRLYNNNLNNWWQKFQQELRDFENFRVAIAPNYLTARLLARSGIFGKWVQCRPGEERFRLSPVPLRYVKEISKNSRDKLHKYNIETIEDLRRQGRSFLQTWFAEEAHLIEYLLEGKDMNGSSTTQERSKSPFTIVEVHKVLEENAQDVLKSECRALADELAYKMRKEGVQSRDFSLHLVYADGVEDHVKKRAPRALQEFSGLSPICLDMFEMLHQRRIALSRMELKAHRAAREEPQLDLFREAEWEEKFAGNNAAKPGVYQNLQSSLDSIRQKNGFDSIGTGDYVLG